MIGILGGGQLGRMLALAGIPLGERFRVLEPAGDPPAAPVAEVVRGAWDDPEVLARFADGLSAVTWEFENVPVQAARALEARGIPVHPTPAALEVAQDRVREKELFGRLGIPTPAWQAVDTRDDLERALSELGTPAVLKTRRMGYDGKGQAVIRDPAGAEAAWGALQDAGPLILEAFVPFDRELSILVARGRDGEIAAWPVVENRHEGGILRRTDAPARDLSPAVEAAAERAIRAIVGELGYVGVLALELFEVRGEILANEIAPRVHNSGHWTQDGARTSQFENHIRAVAGLPLGDPALTAPTVLLNLIGSLPARDGILAEPLAHLHLYGKALRPGRKLGHINVCGGNVDEVRAAAARIEGMLAPAGDGPPAGAGPTAR